MLSVVISLVIPMLVGIAVGYGIREYISQRRRLVARQRHEAAWF